MDHGIETQLIAELDQLDHDCPASGWQELADRVRGDLSASKKASKTQSRDRKAQSSTTRTRDDVAESICRICRMDPPMEQQPVCKMCAKMYKTVGAAAIRGSCDCGHAAEERKVYVYRKDPREVTLCSLRCASEHFRKTFSVFGGLQP